MFPHRFGRQPTGATGAVYLTLVSAAARSRRPASAPKVHFVRRLSLLDRGGGPVVAGRSVELVREPPQIPEYRLYLDVDFDAIDLEGRGRVRPRTRARSRRTLDCDGLSIARVRATGPRLAFRWTPSEAMPLDPAFRRGRPRPASSSIRGRQARSDSSASTDRRHGDGLRADDPVRTDRCPTHLPLRRPPRPQGPSPAHGPHRADLEVVANMPRGAPARGRRRARVDVRAQPRRWRPTCSTSGSVGSTGSRTGRVGSPSAC